MAEYELAQINNHEVGKLFFEAYNIPYQIITQGKNKGKLRVMKIRQSDRNTIQKVKEAMEYAGYGELCDHSNVFRDQDDRAVVTFSPYHTAASIMDIPGYDIGISDLSIYSYGTKTIVIRQF